MINLVHSSYSLVFNDFYLSTAEQQKSLVKMSSLSLMSKKNQSGPAGLARRNKCGSYFISVPGELAGQTDWFFFILLNELHV